MSTSSTMFLRVLSLCVVGLAWSSKCRGDWPESAGPNHDYQVAGTAPTRFSVVRDENILWRTGLPNTGESTPVLAGNRVFITCHTPMTADGQSGRNIFGLCLDADSGKELWRREIPASRTTDMASGFSDNTAASPVTDGKYVCFVNVGGGIRTYDYDGQLIWQYDWIPFGRHHARQQEPILHDGKVIFLKTIADGLPIEATTKAGAKPLGRGQGYWTRLHAFDLATGKIHWVAEAATSVHSASMLNTTSNGLPAILTGRGGGHQPPEEPYGLSMINADTGATLWDLAIPGYEAHQNAVWHAERGGLFVGMQHLTLDATQGLVSNPVSLLEGVDLCRFDGSQYQNKSDINLTTPKRQKSTTYHTNCIVGNFHYFRTHQEYRLGRVNLETNDVEYLQLPVQVLRGRDSEQFLWEKAPENDVKNNDGFVVASDRRAKLDGWGHVSAASPIVVGDYLYMPTMLGIVYVIRWDTPRLSESSLVSVSDLGPAGHTWSLSSLASVDGRLYARTLKEIICIGEQ